MLFNSVNFFITFILFAAVYFIFPRKLRWTVLLLFNAYFYVLLMGDKSIFLLAASFIVYLMAILIEVCPKNKSKLAFLACSIIAVISALLCFKYYNFITSNLRHLSFFRNIHALRERNITTPVGISFYTLQAVSYLVDVYRDKIKAEKHLGYFLVYLGFFGTILSGPIERAAHFLPQLREKKSFDIDRVYSAMGIIIFGLFKKVVIADRIAPYVDKVFNNPYGYSGFPVLTAIVLYSIQLYADFSGYSLMAVGFSKVLGFDIVNNFEYPYFSKDIREFWKRWHISLSSFLMEYLYFPLGGSRVKPYRHYLNIFIVFTVSGFWHGANWTFIVWGALHGIYNMLENFLSKHNLLKKFRSLTCVNVLVNFALVTLAWVFFRADSVKHALHLIKAVLFKSPIAIGALTSLASAPQLIMAAALIALLFIYEYFIFKGYGENKRLKAAGTTVMLILIVLIGQATENSFIYFKF